MSSSNCPLSLRLQAQLPISGRSSYALPFSSTRDNYQCLTGTETNHTVKIMWPDQYVRSQSVQHIILTVDYALVPSWS